jgi:hypothetical protein
VLTPEECQQFIDLTEKMGYEEAMVDTHDGMVKMPGKSTRDTRRTRTTAHAARTHHLMQLVNRHRAAQQRAGAVARDGGRVGAHLGARGAPHPQRHQHVRHLLDALRPQRTPPLLPMYHTCGVCVCVCGVCVSDVGVNGQEHARADDKEEMFGAHYDQCYMLEPWDRSLLTFIVYLTDDFEGGGTMFYPKLFEVRPVKGMACIFFHGEHERSPGATPHDTTNDAHSVWTSLCRVSCRVACRAVLWDRQNTRGWW